MAHLSGLHHWPVKVVEQHVGATQPGWCGASHDKNELCGQIGGNLCTELGPCTRGHDGPWKGTGSNDPSTMPEEPVVQIKQGDDMPKQTASDVP